MNDWRRDWDWNYSRLQAELARDWWFDAARGRRWALGVVVVRIVAYQRAMGARTL